MSNVFIAFQKNEESRCIVEAILADNPDAVINEQPAMVKVDVPGRLVIRRERLAIRVLQRRADQRQRRDGGEEAPRLVLERLLVVGIVEVQASPPGGAALQYSARVSIPA